MTSPTYIPVPASELVSFSQAVFQHYGVADDNARQAAEILSSADLRGIDSHGVARLPRYAELLASGHLNPRPHITTVRSSRTTATVDGDGGLGLIVGPIANEMAVEMADRSGAGWVAVRNSSHYGIAGYYAMTAV